MAASFRSGASDLGLSVGGVEYATLSNTGFAVPAATAAAHAVRADQIQAQSLTAFTTGGTGTAFTLTPTPAITAYTANQTFAVIFNAACGAAPTLQINGIATPPNLVRQNIDGTYSNLAVNAFPSGWQATVKLVSASQALVLNLPPRVFQGSFTRDLAAATGTVAYTGVGFKPRKITCYMHLPGTLTSSNGVCAGGTQMCNYTSSVASSDNTSSNYLIYALQGTGASQSAVIQTLDSDGFTLAYIKTGLPTGTVNVVYMAEE